MRYSKQREALMELLRSTTSHPDAMWLYDGLRKSFPNISLGTVYRNLGMLARNGDILEITCGNSTHYDATTALHYHLHCTRCERIFDIPKEQVSVEVNTNGAFCVNECELLLHGICGNCMKTKEI